MPCRLYLVNCLAINSSYLIPRFYPLQFATDRLPEGMPDSARMFAR